MTCRGKRHERPLPFPPDVRESESAAMNRSTGQEQDFEAKQKAMPKTSRNPAEAEDRKKEILRLFQAENIPPPEIAERIGVTRQYVSLVLKEAGESADPVDVSEEIATIRQLTGYSIQDIAVLLGHGVSRAMVWRWESGQPARIEYARRVKLLAEGVKNAGKQR